MSRALPLTLALFALACGDAGIEIYDSQLSEEELASIGAELAQSGRVVFSGTVEIQDVNPCNGEAITLTYTHTYREKTTSAGSGNFNVLLHDSGTVSVVSADGDQFTGRLSSGAKILAHGGQTYETISYRSRVSGPTGAFSVYSRDRFVTDTAGNTTLLSSVDSLACR